jgi:hypothetical protein
MEADYRLISQFFSKFAERTLLIKDEEEPDVYHEIYVPISKFKHPPQEGDYVSVEIEDSH